MTHLPPDVALVVKEICCSTLPARQCWRLQMSVTMNQPFCINLGSPSACGVIHRQVKQVQSQADFMCPRLDMRSEVWRRLLKGTAVNPRMEVSQGILTGDDDVVVAEGAVPCLHVRSTSSADEL